MKINDILKCAYFRYTANIDNRVFTVKISYLLLMNGQHRKLEGHINLIFMSRGALRMEKMGSMKGGKYKGEGLMGKWKKA
jgi:hypothetical protein